jgi:rhamnosyl/mannosyltransferase
MTYHADIVRQWPALWLYRPVFRKLGRHVGRIIVSSELYLGSSRVLARHRDRCVVIPYGIDPTPFALRPGEAATVERLRQEHGRRLVLFLGVLRSYKGLRILVQAMTRVDGHLLVAGRGQRARLEALADRLDVGDRITFLGEVSETRRRRLLHACEVLVLPSLDRSEAFGIVQLEAMACGKPVVSSDLPTGVRLVNQQELTGLLVAPGNPDALASALGRLLDDEALRTRLGQAARVRVEREFNAQAMVERTLAVYDEVLARTGRPGFTPELLR